MEGPALSGPLLEVVRKVAEAKRLLAGKGTPMEAVRLFLSEAAREKLAVISFQDLVELFLVHITLPREAKTEAEFTTGYDLGSEEILQLQGTGHGGGSKEMVRDHAREGEVEGNPRRYRRWPRRVSNLPGPV